VSRASLLVDAPAVRLRLRLTEGDEDRIVGEEDRDEDEDIERRDKELDDDDKR
jgi:hypothetical protein